MMRKYHARVEQQGIIISIVFTHLFSLLIHNYYFGNHLSHISLYYYVFDAEMLGIKLCYFVNVENWEEYSYELLT